MENRSPFSTVRIPPQSLLSPSRTAAVCGGNVLTSQRIVDVVLKAFHAAAASQGCTKYAKSFVNFSLYSPMYSNLTFGAGGKDKDGNVVAGWGYYEVGPVMSPQKGLIKMWFFSHLDYRRRFRCRTVLAWNRRCAYPHH